MLVGRAAESYYYRNVVPGQYSPASPAPTLISVTPNHGDAAGGVPLALVGTGFAVGCIVVVGEALAASVVRNSAFSISCNSPPTTPGAKIVYVVNPDGQASNGVTYTAFSNALKGNASILFSQTGVLTQRRKLSGNATITFNQSGDLTNNVPPFDPATLTPLLWQNAPYDDDGSTHAWLPTSPGVGNLSNVNAGGVASPTVGVDIAPGLASAIYDGTAELPTDQPYSDYVTDQTGTVITFQKIDGVATAAPNAVNDPGLLVFSGNTSIAMSVTASGIRGGFSNSFDPGGRNTAFVPYDGLGTWIMTVLRWDGPNLFNTTMSVRVSQPSGTIDVGCIGIEFGLNGALCPWGRAGRTLVGEGGAVLAWKRLLSDAECNSMRGYFNTTFLGPGGHPLLT